MHFLKKMGLMLLVARCFITAASAGEVELLNIGKRKTAAFCRETAKNPAGRGRFEKF